MGFDPFHAKADEHDTARMNHLPDAAHSNLRVRLFAGKGANGLGVSAADNPGGKKLVAVACTNAIALTESRCIAWPEIWGSPEVFQLR
jgi:hypothetical protein